MPTPSEELLEVATGLYALDPAGFVPARNARAAALRSDEPELAERVRALRKPSAAAWVVNHLVRADPDQVRQVVELGVAMRAAQEGLDAGQLRELTRQRRRLVAAVTARARELAVEAAVPVSAAVTTQVEATLTAAMIDDDAGRAVRSGLLVGALQATGVDPADVASVVAAPDELGIAPHPDGRRRHLHAVPDLPAAGRGAAGGRRARAGTGRGAGRDAADEAEREAAVAEAREAARAEARRDLAREDDDAAAGAYAHAAAVGDVTRVEAAAGRLDAERDAVRRRLAELDGEADAVEAELRGAVVARQRAERALADATGRRDEAASRLAELD
ncbi:hypothetical protein GCM10009809_16510 [Isoptericola hypogeus]|uniref:Transposase n=1 Tax=Isoptericola hypogeus TaxID=300179 RepID=A0ABP4VBS3_9MICO